MKKAIFAIVTALSLSAAASQYVTVVVCDGGESGTLCRKVTYKVRPASAPQITACTVPAGDAGEKPCPTNYGVPGWLKKLNQAFLDAGFTPAPEGDLYLGGPNDGGGSSGGSSSGNGGF